MSNLKTKGYKETCNTPYEDLNQTDLQRLVTLVNNGNGKAARQARSILEFFHDYDFYQPHYLGTEQAVLKSAYSSKKKVEQDSNIKIAAMPNPGRNHIHFEYSLGNEETKAEIVVMDMFGNILYNKMINGAGQTSWYCKDQAMGMYYYLLKIDNEIRRMEKLLVQ